MRTSSRSLYARLSVQVQPGPFAVAKWKPRVCAQGHGLTVRGVLIQASIGGSFETGTGGSTTISDDDDVISITFFSATARRMVSSWTSTIFHACSLAFSSSEDAACSSRSQMYGVVREFFQTQASRSFAFNASRMLSAAETRKRLARILCVFCIWFRWSVPSGRSREREAFALFSAQTIGPILWSRFRFLI